MTTSRFLQSAGACYSKRHIRPDLTDGGLLCSQGGWRGLKVNRRAGDYQKGDERILGDGDFVKEVLAKAQERMENRYRLIAEGFDFNERPSIL